MEFRILGPLEVISDGEPVPLTTPKLRALLALLAARANRPVASETLVDALWAGRPPPSASKLLRVYVSQLRQALPSRDAVTTEASGYALRAGPDELDGARFERLLGEGRRARRDGNALLAATLLERALALWRGPAFADVGDDEPVRAEATRLEELRLLALEELVEAELELGRHTDVLPRLQKLVAEEPLRERFRAQLMLALYRTGRQAEALEAYADARSILVERLGIEPSSELRALERAILNQDEALAPGATVADALRALPSPPGALLGRDRELRALVELLHRPDVRLVTVTGSGGIGKSRLALAAAWEALTAFANGAALVELASTPDPAGLMPAIARALGAQELPGGTTAAAVLEHLRVRQLLLVLDNVEHLLDAIPQVSDLLAAAPRTTVVATSRVALHLAGEHLFRLGALAVPPPGPVTIEAALDASAVTLFAERARAAAPGWDVDEGNVEDVCDVCRRVDGIPLALELAAARVRTLGTRELRRRLDRPLAVLAGRGRGAPERQQTLRATLEWSHGFLSPSEQRLFARVGVFPGSFSLAACEAVCADGEDVLSDIEALVDASLLQLREREPEPRLALLETVRAFAVERLEASGELEARRRAHALHALVEAEGVDLQAQDQTHALAHLDRAYEDIRAALTWARENDPEVQLRLATALWRFWWIRGLLSEGRGWLGEALRNAFGEPSVLRGDALISLAGLSWAAGDLTRAKAEAAEALGLLELFEDGGGMLRCHTVLGLTALREERYEDAVAHLTRSGDLARELERPRDVAVSLLNLGNVAMAQADRGAARDYWQQALSVNRELGNSEGAAFASLNLGHVAVELNEHAEALPRFEEAFERFSELGFREHLASALDGLAAVAVENGQFARAARLLGAADALLTDTGASPVSFEGLRESTARSAQAGLGEEEFERAFAAGREIEPVDLGRF
jgi:predicted ATPase/DNA-binding SARP family transcriptional activator